MGDRPTRETERYRGRRRAGTPARGRFAAAVLTAFVGAAAVALASGAAMQDVETDTLTTDLSSHLDEHARDLDGDRPNRNERGLNSSVNAAPADVWLLPIRGYKVTSLYGQRWGRLHAGVDLGGIKDGAPVNAVRDGTVILAGYDGGYGNAVRIDHGNGEVTVYGHNSKVVVRVGQQVKAGDTIALAGNTGYSFGTHVHLEIRINGRTVNPIEFFKSRGVDFFLETESVFGGP